MAEDLTVIIVDSGARGHVLSQMYEKSSQVKRIIGLGNDFMGHKRRKEVIIEKKFDLKNPNTIYAIAENTIQTQL